MHISNSVKLHARRWLNSIGFDFHRFSTSEWRWSYDVGDYHPVTPLPRWGYGHPSNSHVERALSENSDSIARILAKFNNYMDTFVTVPQSSDPAGSSPYWANGWFENFDPVSLMGMILLHQPKRYFEIGSGNSTKFARYVIQKHRLPTTITSIDPNPVTIINELCDEVIRQRLENTELSMFSALGSGDILFFDGSHRTFPNSDVTVFFLDILPNLKTGVVIHVHDIFLPWDYPIEWDKKMYSEQYVLAAMLLCDERPFKILLPNFFACMDSQLKSSVAQLTSRIPCKPQGWSFWLEKI
jgi:hypothetical protein